MSEGLVFSRSLHVLAKCGIKMTKGLSLPQTYSYSQVLIKAYFVVSTMPGLTAPILGIVRDGIFNDTRASRRKLCFNVSLL